MRLRYSNKCGWELAKHQSLEGKPWLVIASIRNGWANHKDIDLSILWWLYFKRSEANKQIRENFRRNSGISEISLPGIHSRAVEWGPGKEFAKHVHTWLFTIARKWMPARYVKCTNGYPTGGTMTCIQWLLKNLFISFKCRVTERQRQKERKRENSSKCWSTPAMSITAEAGPGRIQESRDSSVLPGLPHECRDQSTWAICCCSLRHISKMDCGAA